MSPLVLPSLSTASAPSASSSASAVRRLITLRRPPPLLLARASPAAQQQQQSPPAAPDNTPTPILNLSVRVARTAAELRAAAYLRAASFGTYPPGRSEFAARSHRRMKGDGEWEAVTAKVEGKEPTYSGLKVACLIATAPVPSPHYYEPAAAAEKEQNQNAALAVRLAADTELEPSAALLPCSSSSSSEGGSSSPVITTEAVIGTLDVNVGAVLPAEELIGKRGRVGARSAAGAGSDASDALPPPPPPSTRAYLSNVCVAKAARGSGVGKALLAAAEELVLKPAEEGGLLAVPPLREEDKEEEDEDGNNNNNNNNSDASSSFFHLYVHVVHDNAAARALYEGPGGGFRVEAEETEATARGLARPRRLLLHKRLRL